MNNEQLEAIRQRAEKATEGPWRRNVYGDVINNYGSSVLAEIPSGGCKSLMDDAEFIAHAREDIPSLLAEVERLKSQLDSLIGEVFEHCNAFSAPYCEAERIEMENGGYR